MRRQYWRMSSSPKRTRIRRTAVLLMSMLAMGVTSCSMTTAPEAVDSQDTIVIRTPDTTGSSASQLEPPVMVQVPTDIDPDGDAGDPLAVAEAFVTTITNRPTAESDESWRRRWSKWATSSLSSRLGGDRGPDAYRSEVQRRHGLAVGMIVGSAVHDCDDVRCSVDVVADQTFVLSTPSSSETNFVTWKVTLSRSESGWLVDAVTFGAGS